MNPSPEAVEKIRAQKIDWVQDNGTIADSLNVPSVPNPVPQGRVPIPTGSAQFLGLLSPASARAVVNWVNMAEIRKDILARNAGALLEWPDTMLLAGLISLEERGALLARLLTTVPDPAYQAQIPWSVAELGRLVDAEDVNEARMAAEKAQVDESAQAVEAQP